AICSRTGQRRPKGGRSCADSPQQVPRRKAYRGRGRHEFCATEEAMEQILADLRLGLRMLLKAPGFTTISILALALGIGANSPMFSVAGTVLLRPLAYPDPDRLMWIQTVEQNTHSEYGFSPPDFYRVREVSRTFSGVAAMYRKAVNVT